MFTRRASTVSSLRVSLSALLLASGPLLACSAAPDSVPPDPSDDRGASAGGSSGASGYAGASLAGAAGQAAGGTGPAVGGSSGAGGKGGSRCAEGPFRCLGDTLAGCDPQTAGYQVLEACDPGACDATLGVCRRCQPQAVTGCADATSQAICDGQGQPGTLTQGCPRGHSRVRGSGRVRCSPMARCAAGGPTRPGSWGPGARGGRRRARCWG